MCSYYALMPLNLLEINYACELIFESYVDLFLVYIFFL
jgi:hypothetical protein